MGRVRRSLRGWRRAGLIVCVAAAALLASCDNPVLEYVKEKLTLADDAAVTVVADATTIDKDATTTIRVTVAAADLEGISYSYEVVSGGGSIVGNGATATYTAPSRGGPAQIRATVTGRYGTSISKTVDITINKGWSLLGSRGFSPGSTAQGPSLAIALNGSLYAAYSDAGASVTNGVTVVKYTGGGSTGWEVVGSRGFSPGEAQYICLSVSRSGIPMVVFKDMADASKRILSMIFDGTGTTGTWSETLGSSTAPATHHFSTGEVAYLSFMIDSVDTPFVAYEDWADSYKPKVWSFAYGSAWTEIKDIMGGGGKDHTSVWSGGTTDSKYLAYADQTVGSGNKLVVRKYVYAGIFQQWMLIGPADFSAGAADSVHIRLDASLSPIVGYMDSVNGPQCVTWSGGAWVSESTGLSVLQEYYSWSALAFAYGSSGARHIASTSVCIPNGHQSLSEFVFDRSTATWSLEGPIDLGQPSVSRIDLVLTGAEDPVVLFADMDAVGRLTAMIYQ